MPIVREDNNLSNNIRTYKVKNQTWIKPDLEKDNIDLVGKNSGTKSCP